jgi:hypothetical protein
MKSWYEGTAKKVLKRINQASTTIISQQTCHPASVTLPLETFCGHRPSNLNHIKSLRE